MGICFSCLKKRFRKTLTKKNFRLLKEVDYIHEPLFNTIDTINTINPIYNKKRLCEHDIFKQSPPKISDINADPILTNRPIPVLSSGIYLDWDKTLKL